MTTYNNKQAASVPTLEQVVYVRVMRLGKVLTHCKVRVDAGLDREAHNRLLQLQFGEASKHRWTGSDSVDLEVAS